jgi:long-chain acyl-CoA synthetase
MECRNADRTMGRIEDMLRLYRPFIHDHDYTFETGHVRALSAVLGGQDRRLFGWDIDTLDWRDYWLDVHVPGLEKWSLPLLRNERVPEDPPMLSATAAPPRIPRAELLSAEAGAAE